MNREEALLAAGPAAIVRGVLHDDLLNLDPLAMACSRMARAPSASRETAVEWARACIACYEKKAERRTPGHDRQGSEIPLFGLRVLLILRWGVETGHPVLDADDVLQWVQKAIDVLSSPAGLRDALGRADGGDEREHAVLLRERLQVGLPLFEKGLLPRGLLPWFKEAGLAGD